MFIFLIAANILFGQQAYAAEKVEYACVTSWIGGLDCGLSGRCEHHESDAKLVEDAPWVVSFGSSGGNLKRFGGDAKLSLLFSSNGFQYYRVHDQILRKDDILVWHPRLRKLFFASYSENEGRLRHSDFEHNCAPK